MEKRDLTEKGWEGLDTGRRVFGKGEAVHRIKCFRCHV